MSPLAAGPGARFLAGAMLAAALAAQAPAPAPAPAPGPGSAPAPAPLRLAAFFWHDSPNDIAALGGVREALAASGIAHQLTEYRAESDAERARGILQQLQQQGCDLVFAMGTNAAKAARQQLSSLPVVYVAVTNPVVSGIVDGWHGSGCNLAGASNWIAPANVVRVFQLAVPKLHKLGILRTRGETGTVSAAELAAMRDYLGSAGAPRLELVEAIAADQRGIEAAVQQLLAAGVQALWIPIDIGIYQHVDLVRAARNGNRTPIVTTSLQAAHSGACIGVVVDYVMLGRKAAAQAVAILRDGKPPGSLEVATMHGYQVVVNLSAARRAGIELPLSLLVLADELIVEEADRGR